MKLERKYNRRFVVTELEHWYDMSLLNPRFLSGFVFRGQGCFDWHIQSSLERMIMRFHHNNEIAHKIYPQGYEQDMLREFQWKYPKYETSNILHEDEIIEWLSVMQHYGCPTRMVDFTYSPFVALFMAIDSSNEKNDSAIWFLNELILRNSYCDSIEKINDAKFDDKESQKEQIYRDANKIIVESIKGNRKDFDKNIYLVQPLKVNERILVQQGLFAIPEKIDIPFEDNLFSLVDNPPPDMVPFNEIIEYSNSEKMFRPNDYFLIKMKVPLKFRLEITKALGLMNISAETMYPGLEGLAKSLNRQRYTG